MIDIKKCRINVAWITSSQPGKSTLSYPTSDLAKMSYQNQNVSMPRGKICCTRGFLTKGSSPTGLKLEKNAT